MKKVINGVKVIHESIKVTAAVFIISGILTKAALTYRKEEK